MSREGLLSSSKIDPQILYTSIPVVTTTMSLFRYPSSWVSLILSNLSFLYHHNIDEVQNKHSILTHKYPIEHNIVTN